MRQQQIWAMGRVLGAAAMAAVFGAGALAAPATPAERPNDARGDASSGAPIEAIAAHDTFYVWGGTAFDDLNRLEAAVAQRAPHALVLYACGHEASWALLAAAHRFGERYLDLRVRDPGAPECHVPARATAVGIAPGQRRTPLGIDARAVTDWWLQRMP